MFKFVLSFILFSHIVFAAEIYDPDVRNLFFQIEEHLESTDWGYCLWNEVVSAGQSSGEYFAQFNCNNGSHAIQFDVWLYVQEKNTFWAEGFAKADGSPQWYCLLNGEIHDSAVESSSSCTQVE